MRQPRSGRTRQPIRWDQFSGARRRFGSDCRLGRLLEALARHPIAFSSYFGSEWTRDDLPSTALDSSSFQGSSFSHRRRETSFVLSQRMDYIELLHYLHFARPSHLAQLWIVPKRCRRHTSLIQNLQETYLGWQSSLEKTGFALLMRRSSSGCP